MALREGKSIDPVGPKDLRSAMRSLHADQHCFVADEKDLEMEEAAELQDGIVGRDLRT